MVMWKQFENIVTFDHQRHCDANHIVAEAEFLLFSVSVFTLKQMQETRLNFDVEAYESKTWYKIAHARFFFFL